MGSNESYQNKLRYKFNNNYQSIIVSFDIENIVLIAYIVNRIKCCFNIGKTTLLSFLYNIYPIL